MRQRATIGALGLVLVGVVLGATVFRADIAQATGLSQSVTVENTAANPVPVREQNLDRAGNIAVHEQGTAHVQVENTSLAVAPQAATRSVSEPVSAAASDVHQVSFPAIQASLITIRGLTGAADHVTFRHGADTILYFIGFEAGDQIVLPLTQPVTVSSFLIACVAAADCAAEFNVIGS
jgi:hypothetical protein